MFLRPQFRWVGPELIPTSQAAGFVIFTSLLLMLLAVVIGSLLLNRFEIRESAESAPTRRVQDLVALLQEAETKRTSLEQEVDTLRQKLVRLEQASQTDGWQATNPELQRLMSLAGLTPVSGAGLLITLQDQKVKANADPRHQDPNIGKLQAEDLLKLVNELKAGGATGIAINDQRLTVRSEIVQAGEMIAVNQSRLTQPVVVKVLGDPNTLKSTLSFKGGILEYLQFFQIKVRVEQQTKVTLPAFKGSLS